MLSFEKQILNEIKKLLNEGPGDVARAKRAAAARKIMSSPDDVPDGAQSPAPQQSTDYSKAQSVQEPQQTKADMPQATVPPAKTAKSATKRGLFDIGSRGPQVKEIQKILATQGYDDEFRGGKSGQLNSAELQKIADGIYGKKTASAVKGFQADNSLTPTGFVDKATYDAIKKLGMGKNIISGEAPAPSQPASAPAQQANVTTTTKQVPGGTETTETSSATLTNTNVIKVYQADQNGQPYIVAQVQASNGDIYEGYGKLRGNPGMARESAIADARSKIAKGQPPAIPGGSIKLKESKNWIDRTREKTTSNLFERLVKDSAKKVI